MNSSNSKASTKKNLKSVNRKEVLVMKKTFKKILSAIAYPFAVFSILIDESRTINEYGDWNTYHIPRNARG